MLRDDARLSAIRSLKRAATALFCATDQDVVMVRELACSEPGCAPVETVVALLREGEPPWQVRIHRPLLEVTDEDLLHAFMGCQGC